MAFELASGFVELSAKGFGPVSQAIDQTTSKLKGMASTNLGALDSALSATKGHIAALLSPTALITEALAGLAPG